MIRSIAGKPRATLVKIADNAHNSLPERAADLSAPDRERLAAKYRAARRVLWPGRRERGRGGDRGAGQPGPAGGTLMDRQIRRSAPSARSESSVG